MPDKTEIPLYQVDAFTDRPFAGNPAAVCLLERPLASEQMRSIAAEMNLSETAFVQAPDARGLRPLRWFTPAVEVPLCGHATLATSHVLIREVREPTPLRFGTLSGVLTVEETPDGWLSMDFPADPPEPEAPPDGLLDALGCPDPEAVLLGVKGWVVRLSSEADVRSLAPDLAALGRVDVGSSALGIIVTAPGDGHVDFVSRFFGPWVGVDEDPVTGMAHTLLGPYWTRELGKAELRARQLSQRGGELRVRISSDRVGVSGQAVTVFRGSLELPG